MIRPTRRHVPPRLLRGFCAAFPGAPGLLKLRRSSSTTDRCNRCLISLRRVRGVTWRTYPVISLITEAYNLKNFQISFASAAQMPGENIYYDIFAKAEGEAPRTRSEFRQMLQGILADRFQLRTHLEMREMPVYDLVVGKNGPKFKQSAAGAEFSGFGGVNGRNQSMKCTKADMGRLADAIGSSFFVDRPVLDKTGLTGFNLIGGSRQRPSSESIIAQT